MQQRIHYPLIIFTAGIIVLKEIKDTSIDAKSSFSPISSLLHILY